MSTTTDRPHQETDGDVFHTRSPHDPPGLIPTSTLMAWWTGARQRAADATYIGQPVNVEDCWTELAVGTRLAREVTAGRWVTVAELLRADAVSDWWQVGAALNLTGPEAAAGFTAWLAGQVHLYGQIGIGVSPADAEELARVADAVGGDVR